MNKQKKKISYYLRKDIDYFIKDNKNELHNFARQFKLTEFYNAEFLEMLLKMNSLLMVDYENLKQEIDKLRTENKKLKSHMLTYKTRLENLSNKKLYKLYQKLKKVFKDI